METNLLVCAAAPWFNFSTVLLGIFLLGMIVIGIWGMRKTKTLNDFFLGGRSVGPWVSAFAYGTTYFSAVLFIGFGGKVGWGFGLKGLWIAFGNALVGALLAWLILGRRTRRMTQNLKAMTMPEFLNERFGAGYLKMFSALIIFIFLIPYSASVFKGLSHLFEANFHISYDVALLVMIGITGVYLIMGGYFAVTLTDFIQGLIMIVGAIAMVWLLTDKASEIANKPGFGGAIAAVDEGYTKHILKPAPWYALAGLVFMTSFGVWGMPQMVQKFYAVKNESVIVKAAVVTFLFSIIIAFAAYYSGALTHVFPGMPVLNQAGKPDFDRMVPELLTKYLPSGLMAVILLLVLSASMSTLASLVLVSASSIAIDLYKGHLNPNISKENSLAMMRFLSGVFVVVSYFTAKMAEQQYTVIVEMMSVSWGAVAGAFMAPFFYGLYWRRATRAGVWAGMVTGLVLNIALTYYLGKPLAPVAASIAMIVPFAVIPIVSLVTTPPSEALLAKAFAKPDGTAPAGAKPAAVAK